MASLPTEQGDLTFTMQLEAAARQQMAAAQAELEAYRLAVTAVRRQCDLRTNCGPSGSTVAREVLDLLSDLP